MASIDVTLPTLLDAGSQASIDVYVQALKANGDINTAMALDKLSKAVRRIENALRTEQTISIPDNSTPSVTGIAFDRRTITANTTITASVLPSTTTQLLIFDITYSTGPWHLTWDTATFSSSPGGLDSTAGARSFVIFTDDGAGKWAFMPSIT